MSRSFMLQVYVGNVGRDPEMRYLENGSAVCSFSMALNDDYKDKDGNLVERPATWIRVTCWGKLAEIVNQYVSKGRQVLVKSEKPPKASAWITKEGEPAASIEITASDIRFLGSGGQEKGEDDDWGEEFGDESTSGKKPPLPF